MTTLDQDISTVEKNESDLLSAAVRGALKGFSVGDDALDAPAQGANWGADRQIRAEFLIELLTGRQNLEGKSPLVVNLRGARIIGSLDLKAATLTCPLELENCHIDGVVDLNEARASSIRMTGCHLSAFFARQLRTTGDVDLADSKMHSFTDLAGAHIGGHLDFSGANLTDTKDLALNADGLTVDQSLFCQRGFTARGAVRLPGAHIRGQLIFSGARLVNANAMALIADGIIVDGDMYCWFTATGEVRLTGAHIGGDLSFTGAHLANRGGVTLLADGLIVGNNMFCGGEFTAIGEVSLLDAHIGGGLDFTGATLAATPTKAGGSEMTAALAAGGLTVVRDMICGFTAIGEVDLVNAHIGRYLDFTRATLANPGGTALDLYGVRATGLFLLPRQPPPGVVDLTNAKVGTFYDDPESWPEVLRLRGFAYDSFGNDGVSVRDRLRWPRHAGGFAPQVYDQLATVYRRAGEEQAARRISVAKQWRRRSRFNPLNWLWYVTVGYGYRTWLAAVWLAVLVALGTWVFSRAYPAHMIAFRSRPPAFHAFAYTLDLILPIISLGQKSAWQPEGSALLYWSWALTVAGWALTTAVVAGLTGILKRDTPMG